MTTHSYVHYVSSSLGTGQHGGYSGPRGVVSVHVDGQVGEAVSQRANQKLAGLRLQEAGHILETKREKEGKGTLSKEENGNNSYKTYLIAISSHNIKHHFLFQICPGILSSKINTGAEFYTDALILF